jgi:autophagy-related protein 2
LANQWIQDIVRNQLRKFITNATPFHTLTNLGGAVAELVVLPWEEMRHDGNFAKGMRTGTTTFAGAVAYETLNTTSKLTKYAANRLSSATNSIALSPTRWNHNNHGMHDNSRNHAATNTGGGSTALPSRPDRVPRHAGDAAGHALESFTRGLKTANYKIVIVPYREYQRNGPAGAARSVVRGIPVAVLAPLSGATEALSYTLLGVRNQLRPDIRKEEEATQKGMHML